ncbi:hypothetical protein [Kribbella sp. NPDC006257]|uniref:hypothetical protein n=1 Tax=Kribbella sp. NPDC006257 TaxID=3156738 RepID=UPI0033A21607
MKSFVRQVSDRLLEFVVPKGTAEAAQPPPQCRPVGNCAYSPTLQGTLYWDEQHDTSCGCWYPHP